MESKLFESILREATANATVNSLVSKLKKFDLSINADALDFANLLKYFLGEASALGESKLYDDMPPIFNRYGNDVLTKVYAAIAIRSGNPQKVLNFYSKYKNTLHQINLNAVKQAIDLATENKSMSLQKAQRTIENKLLY